MPARGWTGPPASSSATRSWPATRSRRRSFEPGATFGCCVTPSGSTPWLHRLTVNACLDIARHRRRRVIEVELDPIDAPEQRRRPRRAAADDREIVDAAERAAEEELSRVVGLSWTTPSGCRRPTLAVMLGILSRSCRATMPDRALGEMRARGRDRAPVGVAGTGRAGGMTASTRYERNLPGILDDLSAGPAPEYLDDVFARTGRMRQRPGWTFPERWLPVADIARTQAFAPAPPWRLIAVTLVVMALILAALVVVGSQRKVAPAVRAGPKWRYFVHHFSLVTCTSAIP